jgi:hypothetical protein
MITTLRRIIYKFDPSIYNNYFTEVTQINNNHISESVNVMDDGLINYFVELNSSEFDWANNLINNVLGVPPKQVVAVVDNIEDAPSVIDDELVVVDTNKKIEEEINLQIIEDVPEPETTPTPTPAPQWSIFNWFSWS